MTIKNLQPALRTFLLSDGAISTAVGTSRIYPIKIAQGVKDPSVVYNIVSEQTDQHMLGASGLVSVRYQIDAWALTNDLAQNLANLVKNKIDGFRGRWAYGTNSPRDYIAVQGVFSQNSRTNYDDVLMLIGVSRDYIISYSER